MGPLVVQRISDSHTCLPGGIGLAMDIGIRAFDCSFGNLTGAHTDDHFDHSLSAPAVYTLAMLLAKRPWTLFVLPVPYAFTVHRAGRLK